MPNAIALAERGLVPDPLIRIGIRRLLAKRLSDCRSAGLESEAKEFADFVEHMNRSPLALHTKDANAQHYEVPTEFYRLCLGPRFKYSSCYFKTHQTTLKQAEEDMLALTCSRAELKDGQSVLELGCGWGSLSLWMAEKYPHSNITAISNSASQRQYIESQAVAKGFKNLKVITCDMNDFSIDQRFDRVVSVEMFEHMRNYRMLFERISHWLKDDGKLFFHIFCHGEFTYPFEVEGDDNWMGKNFFTGGIMPAYSLPLRFQEHLQIAQQWKVDGTHYARTAEEWLKALSRNRTAALTVFRQSGSPEQPEVLVNRWRIFFLACAELFQFDEGREWFVGHYLFTKRKGP